MTATMLQAWVSWGAKVADQAAHKKLWVEIKTAVEDGALQAGMEIDPPTKFCVVEPATRKRRRAD